MKKVNISVIGLGYVGLPLAVEFSKKYKTIGFDINNQRIEELTNLYDSTDECSSDELKNANNLIYTSNINNLKNCNVHIITVPTPIDSFKSPDLSYLIDATKKIASI